MAGMLVEDAIREFMVYYQAKGRAEETIRRHASNLGGTTKGISFLAICRSIKGERVTMGQVTPIIVSRYVGATTGGQGSRNKRIESAAQLLRWAQNNRLLAGGMTAAILMDGFTSQKAQRQPKYYIPAHEFPRALAVAEEVHMRDRAFAAFVLGTLARNSESCKAGLAQLDLDDLAVELYRQKRKRYTTTGINPDMRDEMEAWGDWYAHNQGYSSWRNMRVMNPDWLILPRIRINNLPNAKGERARMYPTMQLAAPQRIVKRILTALGVTETRPGEQVEHNGEGGHCLRRSGALAMYNMLSADPEIGRDKALLYVQAMLDHEDPRMSLIYIGVDNLKRELNDWLKGHNMYRAAGAHPVARGSVIRAMDELQGHNELERRVAALDMPFKSAAAR